MKYFLLAVVVSIAMTATAQEPSYLPPTTAYIKRTPGGPPNNMFDMIEQKGWVPYKGVGCDDASLSFEEGEDNKQYGDNEYVAVRVQIINYKPDGKFTFDNTMQYAPPAGELKKYEDGLRSEPPSGLSRTITNKEVANGRMVIQVERSACVMTKYKEMTHIIFRSYAIIGTAIANIEAAYNSTDPTLAEKLHNDIVEQIKKTGFK